MPDRLAELRRQRALVQEHLAWLDREIATTSGSGTGVSPVNPPPTSMGSAPSVPSVSSVPSVPEADSILDQYRVPDATMKQDVRKGCLLYFVGALVLLALGVTILFFASRSP